MREEAMTLMEERPIHAAATTGGRPTWKNDARKQEVSNRVKTVRRYR